MGNGRREETTRLCVELSLVFREDEAGGDKQKWLDKARQEKAKKEKAQNEKAQKERRK